MFEENAEEQPFWKIALLIEMFGAISISAFMNIYWMWLIIKQICRLIKRYQRGINYRSESPFGDSSVPVSDDEGAGGATPN